jgi:uncharacterized protein involved in exopolysaccharide biosynthesis
MSALSYTRAPDQTQPVHPSNAGREGQSVQSDIARYARIIFQRLWLILILVLATEISIGAISLTRPPVYETTVRFKITSLPPSDVTLYQTTRSSSTSDPLSATRADFISVLTSLDVAWDTVGGLNLPVSGREIEQMVSVQQSTDSDFIILTVKTDNPQLAADVANGLMTNAVKRYGELNAQPLTSSQTFIATQIDANQKALDKARADLTAFQAQNNLGGLDSTISSQVSLIRSLQLNHDEAVAQGNAQSVQSYQSLIDARQAELAQLINLSSQFDTLESNVNQLQATDSLLRDKMTEAQLKENEARNLDSVQVFGQARVPDQANPRISIPIMVLGGAVALVLGVMLAFLWEYLAPSKPKPERVPRQRQ